TLGNARALGIRASLTGPMTRGDVGTLTAHLAALQSPAPGDLALYVAAAHREIDLAVERGALAPETAFAMRDSLSNALARKDCTSTISAHGTHDRRQVRGSPGGAIRASVEPPQRAATRSRSARIVLTGERPPDAAASPSCRSLRAASLGLAWPSTDPVAPARSPSPAAGDDALGPLRT